MIDKSKNLENFENSNLETNSITSKKSVDVIESEQNEHGVSNEFFLQDKKGEIIVNDSSDNINKDKKKKFDQTKFLDKIKDKRIINLEEEAEKLDLEKNVFKEAILRLSKVSRIPTTKHRRKIKLI